ncbi:Pheromone-processing carboxypeptidase KEX1 [Nakaseomyces glabratus]|uniref:Carboxypeptidase n=1 Tax=Candida glabrata TaxID=5478 RepID=A0A0W0D711_CANGB|nr:Pheromone-processing carboxypeptidase KEX1 [Nakaseomyces glabratus]KTB07619.1 Pheromone-processing carboxypeptidase KEX1 [Nakaseomyces glabratus]KTB07769.1 Pheromone-processing carboxypeptidase KEX1 [Nakaseomyces glabratus]KTB19543.1 Pheromone-processing carboxypeptidase KEX1 [Nakaseomyces glabratus]KTB21433.1 Pheromone-processing carboxypeptidase KEX1 [Nakaseomyces glabratus]
MLHATVLPILLWLATLAYGFDRKEFLVDGNELPGFTKLKNTKHWTVPKMYAGHLPATRDNDTQYFFWKFENKKTKKNDETPLIIWLNGGPGCSSMAGALMEIGPFRLNKKAEVIKNDGSWHMRGSVLFLDQPVGTGFSYSKEDNEVSELDEVADNFMVFLQNYYATFPDDKDRELILAGESYAGQFIPYFTKAIIKFNEQQRDENSKINIKVMFIGNGWLDPKRQYLSYVPFSLEKGIIKKEDPAFKDILKQHETCQNYINSDHTGHSELSYPPCEAVLGKIISQDKTQCINVYKFDEYDSYPSCGLEWPVDTKFTKQFLTDKKVLAALHANDERSWIECRPDVKLENIKAKPAIELIPSLLESGIELILFNGNKDLICNTLGIDNVLKHLQWEGETGFTDEVQIFDWVYRDDLKSDKEKVAGTVKYERQLTLITIEDGSHMVSYDKALISRDEDEGGSNFKAFFLILSLVSAFIIVAAFYISDYIKSRRHPILVDGDGRSRLNKSVTWASDIENGSFDIEDDDPEFGTEGMEDNMELEDVFSIDEEDEEQLEGVVPESTRKSKKGSKKKGKYFSVPNDDSAEDIELQDIERH